MKFTVTITSALLAVAALTNTADAACAFNSPTEGQSFAAGDSMKIGWFDGPDEGPKCEDIKNLAIELRIGSKTQQTPVATVTSGTPGAQMGMTWDIPTQLEQTDDTYFLEMHNADDPKRAFQNFSARFAITGVEASGGSSSSTDEGDKSTGDAGPTSTDDPSSTDEETSDDNTDEEPTDAKSEPDSTNKGDNPNGGSSGAGGAGSSGGSSGANTKEPDQTAAASSWFVSFASLAVVTITVTLSNVF
jgi:hypothetical protein